MISPLLMIKNIWSFFPALSSEVQLKLQSWKVPDHELVCLLLEHGQWEWETTCLPLPSACLCIPVKSWFLWNMHHLFVKLQRGRDSIFTSFLNMILEYNSNNFFALSATCTTLDHSLTFHNSGACAGHWLAAGMPARRATWWQGRMGLPGGNAAGSVLGVAVVASDRCYCFCLHCDLLKLWGSIVNMQMLLYTPAPAPLRCQARVVEQHLRVLHLSPECYQHLGLRASGWAWSWVPRYLAGPVSPF